MRKASHPRSSLKVINWDFKQKMTKRQFRRVNPRNRSYRLPPTREHMLEWDKMLAQLGGTTP